MKEMKDPGILTDPAGYHEITARYNGTAGCGHTILPGEVIGYNPELHRTRCEVCWGAMKRRDGTRKNRVMQEALKLG